MFLIRNVLENDIEDLYELSLQANFINLPSDKQLIARKIKKSIASFSSDSTHNLKEDYYIFVIVDSAKNKVIGSSMIHAQHGSDEEPHFYLKVTHEQKFSHTINTGFTHGMLKLGHDTDGPTEIGGLILHPDYRANKQKLGKQISFVRFLYMGLHPQKFKEEVHSELMPPFDKDGNAPMWEAIGRRFMNMNYKDADLLSRSNKEFILSLFPSDNIYITLLPIEAKNAIGKVGRDTLPVQRMLESIGFKYINEIDPFDGGPHYRSKLSNIKPIKELQTLKKIVKTPDEITKTPYLVSFYNDKFDFCALKINGEIIGDLLLVSPEDFSLLDANFDTENISVIPL